MLLLIGIEMKELKIVLRAYELFSIEKRAREVNCRRSSNSLNILKCFLEPSQIISANSPLLYNAVSISYGVKHEIIRSVAALAPFCDC